MTRVVGFGGSLRAASTSRTALAAALEGAAQGGADTELVWVRDLDLPLYTAEHTPPVAAEEFAETVYRCDAMIWSSPTYHGSVSGSFKNALDWLILLGRPFAAVPVQQADRLDQYRRRGPGSAGRQLDGLHRACAPWLECSARATRGAVLAVVRPRRPAHRRGRRRAAARPRRRGPSRGAPVPRRGHLRLRRRTAVLGLRVVRAQRTSAHWRARGKAEGLHQVESI